MSNPEIPCIPKTTLERVIEQLRTHLTDAHMLMPAHSKRLIQRDIDELVFYKATVYPKEVPA